MTHKEFSGCGLHRIACAIPEIRVADIEHNKQQIIRIVRQNDDCELIVFPELCITGYTCGDLFLQPHFIARAFNAITDIAAECMGANPTIVVGAPVKIGNALFNCALFIEGGAVIGIVPKTYIPNYAEYYEQRWFASGSEVAVSQTDAFNSVLNLPFATAISTHLLVKTHDMTVGAEICEDLWTPAPPSSFAAIAGADVIVNLSASNATIGKHRYRRDLIAQQSARCHCIYAYASAGKGESSTDLAFPGYAAIAEDGAILNESIPFPDSEVMVKCDVDLELISRERMRSNTFRPTAEIAAITGRYTEATHPFMHKQDLMFGDARFRIEGRHIDPHPFVPADPAHRNQNCTEIVEIQCHGLRQRLRAINCRTLVIGVSGGLDSTLALLLACRTFDSMKLPRTGIIGITMPGLATTSKTRNNAWQLMERLGITCLEIPIGEAVAQHFKDIDQDPQCHDAAYENSQARERTQILMDYANKTGGIVLGTGDLSELALGWCTYNGDHMSMYGINASVPKTLVRHLVEWFADRCEDKETTRILIDIVNTPISPELVPSDDDADTIAQRTEDLVGPYELHDFFLFHTLRHGFSPRKIFLMAREAFGNQYDTATLLKWMRNFYRRFFNQQFKRSCMPDGPKVGSVCLSPRGDWRMPSDASATLWLNEVTDLEKEYSREVI